MDRLKLYSFLLLILGGFSACINEVNTDLPYEQKYLVMGYVPTNSGSPAVVKIARSVPLDAVQSSTPLSDVPVQLVSLTENNDTLRFDFFYNPDMEQYYTSETAIAERNHTYWIEFILDGITYRSEPTLLSASILEIEIEIDDTDPYFVTVNIRELFQSSSYFIGSQHNEVWDVFEAVRNQDFYDKNQAVGSLVRQNVFWDVLGTDNWIYVIQLPGVVEEFFREWTVQNDSDSDDPLSQLFAVPPTSLGGNIQRFDGQAQEGGHWRVFFLVMLLKKNHNYMKKLSVLFNYSIWHPTAVCL